MNYSDTFFSLLVPLAVIALVLLSKRVVLSLFVGIVLGGVMFYYQEPLKIFGYVYQKISSAFYSYGEKGLEFNWYGINVFLFLILLGILSQVMIYSGGVSAFVQWSREKIKDARSSEFVIFIAGLVVFIDDYFNALTVGQISRSLNHNKHSSRERMAYIIDSTSAPICVIVPFSSWGAYIIGVLQSNMPQGESNALFVLFQSVGNNFYAWFALFGVVMTIWWRINLPVMRENINVNVVEDGEESKIQAGSIQMVIVPIIVLILSIAGMTFYTGYTSSKSTEILTILNNVDTAFSLLCGGLITLFLTLIMAFRSRPTMPYLQAFGKGIKMMFPALVILILAWAIGEVIRDDLQTGKYLASVAKEFLASESLVFLPVFLFCISAFIAFSTGTSWGCFAIMIPIAVQVANQGDANAIFAISAVLAGAVYGDHTSPMSDTTILSATGSGCSLQSHFITQFPYAGVSALCALCAYAILSLTQSTFVAFVGGSALLVLAFYWLKCKYSGEL